MEGLVPASVGLVVMATSSPQWAPSASCVDGADSPIAGYQPQGLGNRHYGNPEPSNRARVNEGGVMTGAGLCVRGGKRAMVFPLHIYPEKQVERREGEQWR